MDCREVKAKWNSYLNGDLPSKEEEEIDKHIESCSDCAELLSEVMDEEESKNSSEERKLDDPIYSLPIEKQTKMIRKAKWKNRLMNVLFVFLFFIGFSFMTGMFTMSYYGFGGDGQGRGERAVQVVKTATQMTMPNVYLRGGSMNTNFYFTLDIDFQIHKQLGNDSKAIGNLHGKMLLNSLNVNREWSDGQYDVKLHFLHPKIVEKQPKSEIEFYKETLTETWNSLEIIPEGTVSELALTFDNLYEIDEVYNLLEGYDLDIVWYAIDTGVDSRPDYRSPYLSATEGIIGLHEHAVFDFPEHGNSIEVRGEGNKRAEIFKTSLQFLADNEKLARKYIWTEESFKDLYKYVDENGVKTYGVVVTGPTKELLRLQENDAIIYATIGEVDFWNWYNRNASGTIYN